MFQVGDEGGWTGDGSGTPKFDSSVSRNTFFMTHDLPLEPRVGYGVCPFVG